jgi:hypothetical protein
VPKINFNILSYGAILVNLWILFVGSYTNEPPIQLLAILNMILLSLGILLRTSKKKGDE